MNLEAELPKDEKLIHQERAYTSPMMIAVLFY